MTTFLKRGAGEARTDTLRQGNNQARVLVPEAQEGLDAKGIARGLIGGGRLIFFSGCGRAGVATLKIILFMVCTIPSKQ